jgi:hypothetical protein
MGFQSTKAHCELLHQLCSVRKRWFYEKNRVNVLFLVSKMLLALFLGEASDLAGYDRQCTFFLKGTEAMKVIFQVIKLFDYSAWSLGDHRYVGSWDRNWQLVVLAGVRMMVLACEPVLVSHMGSAQKIRIKLLQGYDALHTCSAVAAWQEVLIMIDQGGLAWAAVKYRPFEKSRNK